MSIEQQQQALEAQAAEAEYQGEEEAAEEYVEGGHRWLLFTAVPSWAVSMVVHAVVLLVMAMINLDSGQDKTRAVFTAGPPLAEDMKEIEEFEEQLVTPIDVNVAEVDPTAVPVEVVSDVVPETADVMAVANDLDSAAIAVELSDFGERTAPKNDLVKEIGSFSGSGFEGRGTAAARKAAVRAFGGSDGSEAAVALALKWLAAHQLPDGGWNFDHRIGPGVRNSDHPGNLTEARKGATAMAVLPFLGAGQTHKEGDYRNTVKGGMAFLMTHMKPDGSMHEGGGSMYSHGLASIALCEAYGMTHDKALMAPAQAAVNFIVYAQDPIGGGWRYSPRQPGDTSVVGWQVMALKSAHMAYLQVPPNTVRGAIKFLDAVQANYGANYGYTSPGAGPTTSAVGLLLRMYLGWKHEHEGLKKGVDFLSAQGPSNADMYYNYYATQVMRQFGGEPWEKWNGKMRDFLVSRQDKEGAAKGSWFFPGGHGAERGGRIYNTSLATMILEVYYRHMPLYKQDATKSDFPL